MSSTANDTRLIAFYLPQYHPIPENDAWWGEGFTEWTNVRKALPRFPGHYQPHVPGQLGHYDLRDPQARAAQADLAREYGIHGFCYYHYWFNGKRLLETPFNEVLKSGEPDFPFCLCWANENWTRRWDGAERQILMAQNYSDADSLAFIQSLIPAFRDQRYIRVNGRPLLLVYRTGLLPDPARTSEIWREEMHRAGVGEIYLARVENDWGGQEPAPEAVGFDAAVEFAPNWGLMGRRVRNLAEVGLPANRLDRDTLAQDYEQCLAHMLHREAPPYKRFRGLFPGWDNSARRQKGPRVFLNASPEKYAFWLSCLIRQTQRNHQGDERLVFINAWNEWGEGCHLEPDASHGLAYLEATRDTQRLFAGVEPIPEWISRGLNEREELLADAYARIAGLGKFSQGSSRLRAGIRGLLGGQSLF
jgi:Glycosyltransferase WbsX